MQHKLDLHIQVQQSSLWIYHATVLTMLAHNATTELRTCKKQILFKINELTDELSKNNMYH